MVAVATAALLFVASGCGDGNDNRGPTSSDTPTPQPSATRSHTPTPVVTPSHIDTASVVITTTASSVVTATPIPTEPTPIAMDFSSNVTRFEFERRAGLGFCPPREAVIRADIARGSDGIYRAHLTVLAPTADGEPACAPIAVSPGRCANEVMLPERELSTAEFVQLTDAFKAVEIFPGPDPECETVAFDPCVIDVFQWTRAVGDVGGADLLLFSAGDFPCGNSRLAPSESARLAALFDPFR